MRVDQNLTFRVLDATTGAVVRTYSGHNQATNSMLLGIAHYLIGDGVLNQGSTTLSKFIPKYISLGTMGLINQDSDLTGLPEGIGVSDTKLPGESDEEFEIRRFTEYMDQTPGYGADGYDSAQNNGRATFGLGPIYVSGDAINSELISDTFPRAKIVYREIIPEVSAEMPKTLDVVFSAMISTGALAQFRGDRDYIFITEAGLWSRPDYVSSGDNGLLAGYRLIPPSKENWDMSVASNREILKQQIIRVDINQVVQVIWKVQLGSLGQLLTAEDLE